MSLSSTALGSTQVPTLTPERVGSAELKPLLSFVEAERDALHAAMLESGALLVRGFPVLEPEVFQDLACALDPSVTPYDRGATDRDAVGERVYEASRYPPREHLPIHSETCYLRRFPRRLLFACPQPARRGGETTLADNRAVLAALPDDLRERFLTRGVGYVRNVYSREAGWRFRLARAVGSSAVQCWEDMFATSSRSEVEKACVEEGMAYSWNGDTLCLNDQLPATRVHAETGERVWFNQAHIFHVGPSRFGLVYPLARALNGVGPSALYHATYGDGEPIAERDMQTIRGVFRTHEEPHAWERGDVLLVDNLLLGHGRRPFKGPRSVWFAQAGVGSEPS